MAYKICNRCHIAFDSRMKKCPSCGKEVPSNLEEMLSAQHQEGSGRRNMAGGAACNLCPHCYGSGDWCPIMGD